MFSSLFLSKNQKLVKNWTKEHEQMVTLVNRILAEYAKNNHKLAKKLLIEFSNITLDHLANENIEFYKLLRDEDRISTRSRQYTQEFIETFKDTRIVLMEFLAEYTQKNRALDKEFFSTLTQLADTLVERIDFEEKNLYAILYDKNNTEKLWNEHKRNF